MKPEYQIVSDPAAMTITVGPQTYGRPFLARFSEMHTGIKEEICGPAPWDKGPKAAYQFYASKVGAKFNRRFQAANYWLWVGDRMTPRTGNMLRREGRHWQMYDENLVMRAHTVLPYVNEAEEDDLLHLIPLIVAFQDSPQQVRHVVGRGAWRRAANNSLTRNRLIMQAMARARPGGPADPALFLRLLSIPSGLLRSVCGATEEEMIAARITPRLRHTEFIPTTHMVRDTKRMTGNHFNPNWGYARMLAEHERATHERMRGKFSEKRFVDDWAYEADGFTASLLTSPFDIAAEGAAQHHCVASYTNLAKSGQYLVLRIEGKERATAGLTVGNTIRLDQIYAACNGPVSEACRSFVHQLAQEYSAQMRSVAA